jgi:hypothetical protein
LTRATLAAAAAGVLLAGPWSARAAPPGAAGAPAPSALAPFAATAAQAPEAVAGAVPDKPWLFAGLPGQRMPATRFVVQWMAGEPVLRVQAQASYGNLVHPLAGVAAGELAWRWRVERPLPGADLRSRQGDDVALKVCALFDLPRAALPFWERQLLRVAEAQTGGPLPTATLCYVWAPGWPAGSIVPNAYSARVRYLTLGGAAQAWHPVRRDLAADFQRAFGDEWAPTAAAATPPLQAIAVGADADNTGGESLGFIADLVLRPAVPPR